MVAAGSRVEGVGCTSSSEDAKLLLSVDQHYESDGVHDQVKEQDNIL